MSLDVRDLRQQRRRNVLHGLALLAGMVGVLSVTAWLLAGSQGLVAVGVAGLVLLLLRPQVPTSVVLRMYGAVPLPARAAPELHRLVAALADRAGLPATPRLHYVPSRLLNAFAVGRPDEAAVAVTDGLLRGLDGRELAGVLAHEISHVRADDLWVMSLADVLTRLAHALAYAGLVLLALGLPLLQAEATDIVLVALTLLALPTVVTLLQLALSRSREYDADLEAARLTGDPVGLARALAILERAHGRGWERILAPHRRGPDPLLLRTHPPTEQRIQRLRALTPATRYRVPIHAEGYAPTGYDPVRRRPRLRATGVRW